MLLLHVTPITWMREIEKDYSYHFGSLMFLPVVVRDARFRAGRALVTSGQAMEATGTFVSLLDSCRSSFGEDDIECAAVYYEYGNALFRSLGEEEVTGPEEEEEQEGEHSEKAPKSKQEEEEEDADLKRKAAAAAAEKRFASSRSQPLPSKLTEKSSSRSSKNVVGEKREATQEKVADVNPDESLDKKRSADLPIKQEGKQEDVLGKDGNNAEDENEEEADSEDDQSDMELALANMETAWSILDQHLSSSSPKYKEWGTEQFPRYLTGIGDVLSAMGRHADAADAYSRAVKHRQAQWEVLTSGGDTKTSKPTLEQLICRRRIVETFVLLAEQFLACPPDQDVVTTEIKSLLCKAQERIDYARGYYDKAKDELQETVFLMGQLVAASNSDLDIGEEKENICFASTLLMGVGMELAKVDEEGEEATNRDRKEPAKKKAKLG